MFRYVGVNARGMAVTGSLAGRMTPAEFAEAHFRLGWKELRLTRDGELIGGIGPDLDHGRRIWWAEQ